MSYIEIFFCSNMDKRHFQKRPTSGKIVPLENASSSALFRRDMSSMFMARLGSQFSRGTHFTNRSTETSTRRISTATALKHEMWVLQLDVAIERYLDVPRKYNRAEVFQKLKKEGVLTNWNNIEEESTLIFISHEWVGYKHPDPNGVQLRTVLRVLQRLRDGEIESVGVDPKAEIFHHCKYKKTRKEWIHELKDAYIWFDWMCMPQPMASEGLSEKQKEMLEKAGNNAVMSISAYVERCDFLLIAAPACEHDDRVDPKTKRKAHTCFRTWRRRGWCFISL